MSTDTHDGSHNDTYDVVVIGGGAAGLSGALMLGRARRRVLVIDSGAPRNAPAAHAHGFLSRDGIPPADLLKIGREEIRSYSVDLTDATVLTVSRDNHDDHEGFRLTLADPEPATNAEPVTNAKLTDAGPTATATDDAATADTDAPDFGRATTIHARRLLIATGLTDVLPEVPGLAARWGRDVVHCPYCHGWEFRDQPIGVLTDGTFGPHVAQLFRQWTPRVTLLRHHAPAPSDAEVEQLAARGIAVVDAEVAAVEVTGDAISGVRLVDGRLVPLRAIAVAPRMVARAGFLADLGLTPVEHPSGAGTHLPADPTGRTSVPGVWAAGNVTEPTANLVASAAQGAMAGAMINMDLVRAETDQAVAAYREPFSSAMEARVSAIVLGDRRHGIDLGIDLGPEN